LQVGPQLPPSPGSDGDAILRASTRTSLGQQIMTSEMIIHGRRGSRSIRSKSWIQDQTRSFTEYLDRRGRRAPRCSSSRAALDLHAGLGSDDPHLRHMLRQSVMARTFLRGRDRDRGSSRSTAPPSRRGEDRDRPCWCSSSSPARGDRVLQAEDLGRQGAQRRAPRGAVRQEREAPQDDRGQERRSRQGRWVATRVVFKDALKDGDGTEFVLERSSSMPPSRTRVHEASLR